MNAPDPKSKRNPLRRMAIAFLVGLPTGGVAGYGVGWALKRSGTPPPDVSFADFASIFIGVVLLLSAGYAFFATTSTRRWNRLVERQPSDEPVDPETLQSGRRQGLVAALAGAMYMTPPIALFAGLASPILSVVAAGLFVLLAIECWINWTLWRDGDELTRTVIAQTGAVCFWVLQLGLFVWASLTKLKLASEIDAWSLMTVVMGAYLIGSVVISTRRGLVTV